MLAVLALGSLALEEGLALMTCPAHTLRWCFTDHFFGSCTVPHSERTGLLVQLIIGRDSPSGECFALWLFGLGARKSRAFLATGVLTMGAGPVGTERCLATMAGAMDPHSNLFFDSRYTYSGRHNPLSRLQRQSVFSEESSSLLLLDSVILFGRHGDPRFAGNGNGSILFDDLGYTSRDR